ncbi:MAG TPA: hypothetical protein VHK90_05775 [Thermoanaerobaculia bacterium]|nr:hypothetical protein [Thermoanaerobaculia bacterium]
MRRGSARTRRSTARSLQIRQAETINAAFVEALRKHGFGLRVPAETLADALGSWPDPDESARHLDDCDTGSLICIAIGEVLGLPLGMIAAVTARGSRHNYVRWQFDDEFFLAFDVNLRQWCAPPVPQPPWTEKPLTRNELLGYRYAVRGSLYVDAGDLKKALRDQWRAYMLYSRNPIGCALAASGFHERALVVQTEAVELAKRPAERRAYERRLEIIRKGGTCVAQE